MTDLGQQLSAYLDGELPEEDARRIEALLETDEVARAEFDALMAANAVAQAEFEEMLHDPAPLALARAIRTIDLPSPPEPVAKENVRRIPAWAAVAASAALIVAAGLGGYVAGTGNAPEVTVASGGWLQDIADYHGIYARQSRHLVEIGADERDHIRNWLGDEIGTTFSIPDLSGQGLTFEGGRLLVAAGNPVAQLVYTDGEGIVLALCLKGTDKPDNAERVATTIDGFDMVSWRADGADLVIVGPGGYPDLARIVDSAADQV